MTPTSESMFAQLKKRISGLEYNCRVLQRRLEAANDRRKASEKCMAAFILPENITIDEQEQAIEALADYLEDWSQRFDAGTYDRQAIELQARYILHRASKHKLLVDEYPSDVALQSIKGV